MSNNSTPCIKRKHEIVSPSSDSGSPELKKAIVSDKTLQPQIKQAEVKMAGEATTNSMFKLLMVEIQTLKTTMKDEIIASIREEMNNFKTEMQDLINKRTQSVEIKLTDKIQNLETTLNALVKRVDNNENTQIKLQEIIDDDHTDIKETMNTEKVKSIIQDMGNQDMAHQLIVKNLKEEDDEDEEIIQGKINALFSEMELAHLDILSEKKPIRIGLKRKNPEHNRPVSVWVKNDHAVHDIMKKKKILRTSTAFVKVYIEMNKSLAVQVMEANIRRLAKEHFSLEFRHGRVITKDLEI